MNGGSAIRRDETTLDQVGGEFPTRKQVKDLATSLLCLMAAADEACVGLGVEITGDMDLFQRHAFRLLGPGADMRQSSLCRTIQPSKMRVLPKLRTPQQGLTLRSLTFHLGFYRGSVNAIWHRAPLTVQDASAISPQKDYRSVNLLVVPWPCEITPRQFESCHADKLPRTVDHFQYNPPSRAEARYNGKLTWLDVLIKLYQTARSEVGAIHGVVMPEGALTTDEFELLADYLNANRCGLVAGTVKSDDNGVRPKNQVSFSFPFAGDKYRVKMEQSKHHGWCLDASQLKTYGIGSRFPRNSYENESRWWEGIELSPRALYFFPVEKWLTFATLVCEDLARQDPVAELVRAVAPNLVVALLLDGPQLKERWSSRYATVLADDPGSSVLAVTALGMAKLSRPNNVSENDRVVAIWKEAGENAKQISLPHDKHAVVLCLKAKEITEMTTDGRDFEGTILLQLNGTHPIGIPGGLKEEEENRIESSDKFVANTKPIRSVSRKIESGLLKGNISVREIFPNNDPKPGPLCEELTPDEVWALSFLATLKYGAESNPQIVEEIPKSDPELWGRAGNEKAREIRNALAALSPGTESCPEGASPALEAAYRLRAWVKQQHESRGQIEHAKPLSWPTDLNKNEDSSTG